MFHDSAHPQYEVTRTPGFTLRLCILICPITTRFFWRLPVSPRYAPPSARPQPGPGPMAAPTPGFQPVMYFQQPQLHQVQPVPQAHVLVQRWSKTLWRSPSFSRSDQCNDAMMMNESRFFSRKEFRLCGPQDTKNFPHPCALKL